MLINSLIASNVGDFTTTMHGTRTSTSCISNVVMKVLSCDVHSNQAVGQIYHANLCDSITCEYAHTTKVYSNRAKPWHIYNSWHHF